MNWLFSSSADDRHPYELLHQAPAEPVHKARVWYHVSAHLLEMSPCLPWAGSSADAELAAEFTLSKALP